MENFYHKNYPTKAGVYAVRQAPIIAKNITRYVQKLNLIKYSPQTKILQLINTGDESAIALKYGYAIHNYWIWILKDYIDKTFINSFS